jgi:hypothetical protein
LGQVALVWLAVFEAGTTAVRMGADRLVAVADLVPALCLKERGSVALPSCCPATFHPSTLLPCCPAALWPFHPAALPPCPRY